MVTEKRTWLYDLLLIAVLIVAAYFRVLGLNWDENQHLHPDERFLTMVESALAPAQSLSQYFDTANSPLNPNNRGYGFFVYGTLPIFVVRYLAEWLGQVGYDQVYLVGRQVSAAADLGMIVLLYFIAARLYGRKVGLLAATFSSLTVMQIQQSHFFTVDNPANFFTFLAVFFAVLISTSDNREKRAEGSLSESVHRQSSIVNGKTPIISDPLFLLSIGFGVALGMAVASKLNAAPLAVLLPTALFIRFFKQKSDNDQSRNTEHRLLNSEYWSRIIPYLIAGGLASILIFRICQPYAFSGLGLNSQWLANLRELQAQSSGDVDVPFALQWACRSHLYSFQNLTTWGLGLPLGILAWAGFLWMGWRTLKGEWQHALLWGWSGFYFLWQSLAFNPTMRYQLPVYPLLSMVAAWLVFKLWDEGRNVKASRLSLVIRLLSASLGILVLVLTFAWAYAFTRIYTRPHTRVTAARWIYKSLPGPINLYIARSPEEQAESDGEYQQPLPFPYGAAVSAGTPYISSFSPNQTGELTRIYLPHVVSASPVAQTLTLVLASSPDISAGQALATVSTTSGFSPATDPRGEGYVLKFDQPVPVTQGQTYFLRLETTGSLFLAGAAPINESSWDDGLPLRMDGYDGFGGLYNGALNLELYWDDNTDKLNRFVTTLDQGDYIFITSNRQWASLTRIPERYPLTTEYYRLLIGCPANRDLIWCYNVARPGQFSGQLGFDLVAVFESYPTLEIPGLFKWEFNDQFAEEAFTVYDHPKVLIFKKNTDFDSDSVKNLLGTVDMSRVAHLTPKAAGNYKDLMLPADRLAQQQANGTWSQLFNYDWIQNKYPALGALFWYAFIFIIGLCAYPFTRLALPGLNDRGYAISRVLGLALLAYGSWLAGSVGIPYTRFNIGAVFVVLAAAGLGLGWMRRDELRRAWKSNRRYFLMVEILFFLFFVLDLLIRFGNPDLWHPAKGGERPMDFSYFNAVLKSTSFPPYDPWFAGGYINYYYYGFVLVGTPVKLLGIVPSIAYNYILPTLFAMVAVGAFVLGWNLLDEGRNNEDETKASLLGQPSFVSGISASLMVVVLGNLGTVRMLFQGYQRMAAPGGIITDANILQRWSWALRGFLMSLTGALLPFARGDWYWFPSRVIPAPNDVEPITEFPFFTFLYSDMHAHMIVLPITLFILAWSLSFLKARAQLSRAGWIATFAIGGLMIGALRPTNTWDLYTYFPLAALAVVYTLWRHVEWKGRYHLPDWIGRAALAFGAPLLLYLLASIFYAPFSHWFAQAYGAIDPWFGSHTPIWSYFTHWGLFLFLIIAWMIWETRQWMAITPVSELSKLRPYQLAMELSLAFLLTFLLYFALKGVWVGWLALPLAAWAGILILRPDQPGPKRAVLMMIGTALVLTIAVDLVVLRGDIGRMNTVFKLYLQAWTLLAISAAAASGWLITALPLWLPRWRNTFQAGVLLLLAGALLFTLSATPDKIADRMAPTAPHTLDSMTFMAYAEHWDGDTMQLGEDYRAIRWMEDNVQGSPIIVEANCSEYRWCTRFTIYTGLPGVVGWNWHQRQQRALVPPNWITDRIAEIDGFYMNPDPESARAFLKKYHVKYIVVGQLERNLYPSVEGVDGLAKFEQYNGKYWRSVYREAHTVIYEVLPS
jgi:YYY domain-containing protein